MNGLTVFGIILSVLLHIADQASDIFVGFLFYFEGQYVYAGLTLALVCLPGFCIFLAEFRNTCKAPATSFLKAIFYLLFSPLWAVIVHLVSLYDARYVRSAFFFKTMEGFLEAGPQLALQLSLLFRGSLTRSSHMVLQPAISQVLEKNISLSVAHPNMIMPTKDTFDVFGREYDMDARYWFGCVHVVSVVISFISILTTSIVFNDLEDSGGMEIGCAPPPASRAFGRFCCGFPFFFLTLLYRSISLALIICYVHVWSGIVIFAIFFGNVLTALFSGDNFVRSVTYAVWSMLVPAGYNRNPSFPLGYSMIPVIETEAADEKEIERLGNRAKYFLSAHVLGSIFLVGGSVVITIILVMTYPDYYELNSHAIFSVDQLSLIFFPLLGLTLGLIVLLVRPYHRCDCSGGEPPSGNIIV